MIFFSVFSSSAGGESRRAMDGPCRYYYYYVRREGDDVEISKRVRHHLESLSFFTYFLGQLILGLGQHSDKCRRKQTLPTRSLSASLISRLARTFVVSYVFLITCTAPANQRRVSVYSRSMLLAQDDISFESDMMV